MQNYPSHSSINKERRSPCGTAPSNIESMAGTRLLLLAILALISGCAGQSENTRGNSFRSTTDCADSLASADTNINAVLAQVSATEIDVARDAGLVNVLGAAVNQCLAAGTNGTDCSRQSEALANACASATKRRVDARTLNTLATGFEVVPSALKSQKCASERSTFSDLTARLKMAAQQLTSTLLGTRKVYDDCDR